MCRHLGYLGPPIGVGDILTRGTHSLRTQAWAPRDMRGGGTINADGFGAAWWIPDIGARPHDLAPPTARTASRYRNAVPIWTDPAVDEVLPQLHSRSVLAAVRSATIGMPVERSACAPFTHGRWAFSHNGVIQDWQRTLTAVAVEFSSPSLIEAESRTDSATLWVILRDLLERKEVASTPSDNTYRRPVPPGTNGTAPAAGPKATAAATAQRDGSAAAAELRNGMAAAAVLRDGSAVASAQGDAADSAWTITPARAGDDRPGEILRQVASAVLRHSPGARLNLLLSDGETLWATTVYHSLAALITEDTAILASEPFDDDPRWREIPDRRLVVARPGSLSVASLELDESERALT
ncbi:class II glutamine amidotransferase [Nocardia pseudobrasiliensis]|uniref:Gamma-glutamyl-hercynylcysteine sulfoxide hydrolase n=1 Tax=Nocardia pseudobrasiliensis TaxID=45979 RepID=A0A370IBL3_9NOCA|nr:class II glutamine amidotransferase [Nocardia pseudobrasiliensis]RDI66784.1 glutamine amidotransferase [Nocardia pseudobrasiliensis]